RLRQRRRGARRCRAFPNSGPGCVVVRFAARGTDRSARARARSAVRDSSTMSGRLSGKTALITGAGQGIGRAAAIAFAAEGATVWATDRDGGSVATLEGCTARELDVLDPERIAAVMREAGTLDVLFNCAGHV